MNKELKLKMKNSFMDLTEVLFQFGGSILLMMPLMLWVLFTLLNQAFNTNYHFTYLQYIVLSLVWHIVKITFKSKTEVN